MLSESRQVSQQEGKEMAEQWNSPTVETSAKHNENVGKCFAFICALEIGMTSHAPPLI